MVKHTPPVLILRMLPLMVALLLGAAFVGCSSSVLVPAAELPNHATHKFNGLVRTAAVVGVVLSDLTDAFIDSVAQTGDSLDSEAQTRKVQFGEQSGSVDLNNETVSGTTEDGTPFTGAFVDLRFIMVKETDIAHKFVTPNDLSCDIKAVLDHPDTRLKRGASPCWDVIEFNGDGGTYDPSMGTISGTTKRGTPIVASSDDVIYAYYDHFSIMKNVKIAATLAVLVAMSNVVLHFFSP